MNSDAPRLFRGNQAVYSPKISAGRQGGVAAEFSEIQLQNPLGSTHIMYVDKVVVGTGLPGLTDIIWQFGAAVLATVLNDRSARNLVPAVTGVLSQPRTDSNVVAPVAGPIRTRVGEIPEPVPLGLWFPADEGILFRANVVNVPLIFTWYWYEIPVDSFQEFVA